MKIKLCKSGSGSKPQNPLNKEKVTLEAKEAKLFCVLRSRKEKNFSLLKKKFYEIHSLPTSRNIVVNISHAYEIRPYTAIISVHICIV